MKNTLNESFYQWIKEIKVFQSKLKKLKEELKFYNSKLIGCSSISYDIIRTSSSISSNDKITFWLIKIEEVENEIKQLIRQITPFNSFVSALSTQEQQVLELLIISRHRGYYVTDKLGVSRNRVYEIRNSIISKWAKEARNLHY